MTNEGKERLPLYCEYRGPGPLAYKLKPLLGRKDHDITQERCPAYSISLPHITKDKKGPGPADYTLKDTMTVKGPQGPAPVTLKGRTKLPEIKRYGPAPGAYDIGKPDKLSTRRSAPAPKIGYRYNLPDYRCGPGPTAYSLPSTVGKGGAGSSRIRKPPTWTFKGRMAYGSPYWEGIAKQNPAPSDYSCQNHNQNASLSFSMQGRTQRPNYNSATKNPAPGSYNALQTMGQQGKGFTMGSRHSQNALVCITMADTVY